MQLKPYIRLARFLDRLACLILRISERLSPLLLTLRYNLQRATRSIAAALWNSAYVADPNFALRALREKQGKNYGVDAILRRVHLPMTDDVEGKAVTR